jgi:GDPmannose 4,6-dehydratase
MKTALITGITGQDGSYLAELLLSKDYVVHGIVRHVSNCSEEQRYKRIYHLLDRIHLHEASVENYGSLFDVIKDLRPDECYHLAAQSFVSKSFVDPFTTFDINITGTNNILSILYKFHPHCKFYFAASSEMFGNSQAAYQDETTKFDPVSPYGITKVTGFELTKLYREAYGMFACSGILFNHESPRRGYQFISKKIATAAVSIRFRRQKKLRVGNIDARRDWGFAPDYVRAMWLMLQQPNAKDYVIATGQTHSVRQFLELAFKEVGLNYLDYTEWNSTQLERPMDIQRLCGDSTKARNELDWQPLVDFDLLVTLMIEGEYGKTQ